MRYLFAALLLLHPVLLSAEELTWPPVLPGGKSVLTASSPLLLRGTATLKEGVKIAKTAPSVDFLYFPGQSYAAKLWSAWGDNLAVGDRCYSAIGDHDGPRGNAFLHEYDAGKKELKQVVDVRKVLDLPEGHYTPGKIHSALSIDAEGWIYFSTHRGSTRVTTAKNHFKGDWLLRYRRSDNRTEVIAHAPLANQSLPTGWLDSKRKILYSGTQDGANEKKPSFLAYDVEKRKVLYTDDAGPSRALILAESTGRVYFHRDNKGDDKLVRFDPAKPGPPVGLDVTLGLRAASREHGGMVYTADRDGIWVFDTRTEKAEKLGPSAVGSVDYITSLHVDTKTGRYLYYVPGAHGGAERDGSPLVQFDVKTRTRKVIAFLHPFCFEKAGYVAAGAYGLAVSPGGDRVYITWNGKRGAKKEELDRKLKWNTCAFTVVHIPAAEREP
jgi:hypothetical protein